MKARKIKMNELIKIVENEDGKQVVSGRELHEFLGVSSRYNDWFKNRVTKYDFVENQDFVAISKTLVTAQGNQSKYTDHAVTLGMAKELCMVENNDLGKQARRYFIECENKQAKALKALELVDLELSNQLVFSKNGSPITTSRIIATAFNKEYDNVIKDIEDKIEELSKSEDGKRFSLLNFEQSTYLNDRGREYKEYELTEQGFSFVVLGYTGEKANDFKIQFIDSFFKMRETVINLYKARLIENVIPQKTGDRQFVYIIKNIDSSNIKIGVGNNPEKRVKQLQTVRDCELKLVYYSYICSNAFDIETIVHENFSDYHVRGEWYKVKEDEVIKFLEKQNYVLKSEFLAGIDSNEFFKDMLIGTENEED